MSFSMKIDVFYLFFGFVSSPGILIFFIHPDNILFDAPFLGKLREMLVFERTNRVNMMNVACC